MKHILIGLLVLGSISSFAGSSLKVTKCHYHQPTIFDSETSVTYKCKDISKSSKANKVSDVLERNGFNIDEEASQTIEVEIFNPGFFSQTQNGLVTKRVTIELKDSEGNVLKSSAVAKSKRPMSSINPIVELAVEELAR
jgi:DNA gyrase/topoisomerase IV subunit B